MAKKILIVDDDAEFKEAVSALLVEKGYQVFLADDGTSGFETAKREIPDLILLDVMMRHLTEGFDIARKLHADPATQEIPLITVTGIRKETKVGFKYEPDEVWLPVKAVLEKPVKPEVLLKAIEENIGK